MLNQTTHHGVYVLDQDQALDFYVGKLGLEVSADVDLGFMRWLTVTLPGDDHHVLLEVPGPPAVDESSAEQLKELITKGAMGLAMIITTDDAHRTHAELRDKGVDMVEEPTDRPYGIDFGIRDPFGNHIRVTQPKQATDAEVRAHFEGEGS